MNIYNNQCMNPCLQAPSGFMDVINKGAYVATFAIAYFLMVIIFLLIVQSFYTINLIEFQFQ
ncbi:hypothetical protein [Clostridium haemolyticum]|uniref:hypothetical protein n=1 Tax=Clostridium haemolyticum TaxID=84025 RepID=UPI001FBB51AF|nr:hypothetical protein [Clostridium haemolyticum]